MHSVIRIFTIIPTLALLTMCAPTHPIQPQPDPVKDEIAVLQKQLLELQKLQNDTKTKLDEANDVITTLSARLKAVETKQSALAIRSSATVTGEQEKKVASAHKKKPAKKKKKVRRQE